MTWWGMFFQIVKYGSAMILAAAVLLSLVALIAGLFDWLTE